jgi:hypothetical protein
MRRRLSLLPLPVLVLTALAVLAFGAGGAGATVFGNTAWDVSIDGKQTVKWSFEAEAPDQCIAYYGSPSHEAKGSGSVSLSFATKKKQPLWAETYMGRGGLQFMSFSTDGWSIPAVFTKQGKFSVTSGMPCDSEPGDPPPLPEISDDSNCGTKKTKMDTALAWSKGKFQLIGSIGIYPERCPGVFEQGAGVDGSEPCTTEDEPSGIEGTILQPLDTAVPASDFYKGERFTVEANHKFRCEFPSFTWPNDPPLKVELSTRYEVTFKPRKR